MVRSLVERSLRADGFEVAAYPASRQAIKDFHGLDPDVLVADIDLGERPNGIELATLLRAQAPYLGVVFLSNYPNLESIEGSGAAPPGSSFIHKSMVDTPDVLRTAVDTALDDSRDPMIVGLPDDRPLGHLSGPQLTMLRYIAEGWSNAEISERRGISQRAVERLVSRTFHALGVTDDPSVNPRVLSTRIYIQSFGIPEPEAPRPP